MIKEDREPAVDAVIKRVIATAPLVRKWYPSGQEMTEAILQNQYVLMRLLVYLRTGHEVDES